MVQEWIIIVVVITKKLLSMFFELLSKTTVLTKEETLHTLLTVFNVLHRNVSMWAFVSGSRKERPGGITL